MIRLKLNNKPIGLNLKMKVRINTMRHDLSNVASIQPAEGDRIYLSLKKEGKIWRIIASTGDDIDSEFRSHKQALDAIQEFEIR
jgi:hypothetical protein